MVYESWVVGTATAVRRQRLDFVEYDFSTAFEWVTTGEKNDAQKLAGVFIFPFLLVTVCLMQIPSLHLIVPFLFYKIFIFYQQLLDNRCYLP